MSRIIAVLLLLGLFTTAAAGVLGIINTTSDLVRIDLYWVEEEETLGPYYIPGDENIRIPLDNGTYDATVGPTPSMDMGTYTLIGIEIDDEGEVLLVEEGPILVYA